MGLAAIDGSICKYNTLTSTNEIVLTKGRDVHIVSPDTFFELYTLMGDGYASLTSDTIEYALWHRGTSIHDYPKWVRDEMYKNNIFYLAGDYYFNRIEGEQLMLDNDILLRNHRGDVMYIGIDTFNMLYTVIGGRI